MRRYQSIPQQIMTAKIKTKTKVGQWLFDAKHNALIDLNNATC